MSKLKTNLNNLNKNVQNGSFWIFKFRILNLFRISYFGFRILSFLIFCLDFSSLAWAHDIQGRIGLTAPLPPSKVIHVKKKNPDDAYPEEQISPSLILSPEGGVKNALVFLEGDFKGVPFPAEAMPVVDQKDYHFEPHVLFVQPNLPFHVTNLDPVAHDVRIFKEDEMLFRFEINESGKPVEQKLAEPGIYTLRCGLHGWMHGFIVSKKHPYYAVTDSEGNFLLKDVPAGKQTLHLWHETLGEVQMPLEVTESIKNFSYLFKPVKE